MKFYRNAAIEERAEQRIAELEKILGRPVEPPIPLELTAEHLLGLDILWEEIEELLGELIYGDLRMEEFDGNWYQIFGAIRQPPCNCPDRRLGWLADIKRHSSHAFKLRMHGPIMGVMSSIRRSYGGSPCHLSSKKPCQIPANLTIFRSLRS